VVEQRLLNDWLDTYMEYTDDTEPPELFRLWSGISVLAGAMQRTLSLDWGMETVYPNLFVILVGPAGSRKGTAMRPGQFILQDSKIKTTADSMSREAFVEAFISAESTTMVSETKAMIHSSLTVYHEEIAGLFRKQDPDFMNVLTQWFDCPAEYNHKTIGRGDRVVNNLWLNLIGATTPELLRMQITGDTIGSGFTSRVIFVKEDKKAKVVIIPKYTEKMREQSELLSADLLSVRDASGKFTWSQSYEDRYRKWRISDEKSPRFTDPNFDGYCNRRSLHLRKLSMIMSMSRGFSMIMEAEDFDRALDVLERTEKNMGDVFGGIGADPLAAIKDKIIFFIRSRGICELSELHQAFMNDLDDRNFAMILAQLTRARIIDTINGTKIKYIKK